MTSSAFLYFPSDLIKTWPLSKSIILLNVHEQTRLKTNKRTYLTMVVYIFSSLIQLATGLRDLSQAEKRITVV